MSNRIGVPTQGAQLLQKEGGGWRVHLLDDVGRGYPRMIAVVPVLVREQKLKLAQGSLQLGPPGAANQPHAVNWHLHENLNQHSGSYEFEMPAQGDCPLGGDQWLALMVFNQQGGVPPIRQVAKDLATAIRLATFDAWRSGMLPAAPAPAHASRERGAAQPIRFVLCSCQYPHDVIDRMPEAALASPQLHGPADASMLALAHLLEPVTNRPALLIQAGDQVYVDATAGLFDPMVLRDRFRRPYQLLRISQGSIELQRRQPTAVERLIDDHEISDNWEPGDADPPGSGEPLKSGVDTYWELQRLQRNPGQTIWRHRNIAGLAFFFTDTRTGRQARLARNWRECLIMDETQEQALSSWLDEHAGQGKPPCFIASPSMLLPRPLALRTDDAAALHCDGWAGYPRSLHRLLAGLCKRQANNVVFLSGDEHLSALATIDIRCNSEDWHAHTHSIHSSAMYAPYPFANAREADFAEQEKFTFSPDGEAGRTYTCHVSTKFPRTGDGFAVVQCEPTAAGWTTTVDFHRNRGGTAVHLPLR